MPMTTYHVLVTTQAAIDLQNIDDYISNELLAPTSAIKIISSIKRKIRALSLFPERGAAYRKEPWLSRGTRIVQVKNYKILFMVNKRDKTVTVLHISYSRRDIDKLLD